MTGAAPGERGLRARVAAEARRQAERARERFGGLGRDRLNWRPEPGRWSVGQCLDHLAITNALYLDALEGALEDVRRGPVPPDAEFPGGWFGRWFTRQMEPGGRPVKVPGVFRPSGEDETLEPGVVDRFVAGQERLARVAAEDARGVDLDRVRIPSPVTSLLRFRVSDALRIVLAHNRRHLGQADGVVDHPSFPAA